MSVDFDLMQNDTRPSIIGNLSAASTDVFDSVTFKMEDKNGVEKVNQAGQILTQPSSSSGGQVKYQWLTGDTDTAGDFRGQFVVVFDDGRQETYPNRGYIRIHIEQAVS